MDVVADHYADCAEILKNAGFDMVLLHGGHGWLLDQFISPKYNTRTDGFGGSLENRARFPLMVIDRVRRRCGENFLIEYRMSGVRRSRAASPGVRALNLPSCWTGKVDLIHVSAGLDTEEAQAVHTHPTMFLPHGVNVHYAAAIKAAGVKTPVVTLGAITDPALAEQILADGKADVIAMARASIADPHFRRRPAGAERRISSPVCAAWTVSPVFTPATSSAAPSTAARHRRAASTACPPRPREAPRAGGWAAAGGMKAAARPPPNRGHTVTLADSADQLGPAQVHRLRRSEGGPDAARKII